MLDLIQEIDKVIENKMTKNIETVKPPRINKANKGRPKGLERKKILIEIMEKEEAEK